MAYNICLTKSQQVTGYLLLTSYCHARTRLIVNQERETKV